ncbi:MAG: hypothetical protein M1829_004768 [Trizodia sp. TS-e1964]|nr:MAG: hypothetical protein M1829_004768 [Trizodia sp. TS-e1964]
MDSEPTDRPPNAIEGLHNLVSGLSLQSPIYSGDVSPVPAPEMTPTTSSGSSTSAPAPHLTLFNTPSRSIFTSGPPTSSVSSNTAQASMSASALSAQPISSSGVSRKNAFFPQITSSTSKRARLTPRAENGVDESTLQYGPSSIGQRPASSPSALTKLFAATSLSPPLRRSPQNNSPFGGTYVRAPHEMLQLPQHIYTRGFLDGRHSDITIKAFSSTYKLHRILLDRSPYFSSALSEPWFESSATEITLYPEDTDQNITKEAFELALKRLYGCVNTDEEDREAIGIVATGCWLEMIDLVESAVESILRQMGPSTLSHIIQFATSNYYGRHGDRLLQSAKAMLHREGWEMHLSFWDGIDSNVVCEIVGGDGFFVPGEWERWRLAKRLLDRRLRAVATQLGIFNASGSQEKVKTKDCSTSNTPEDNICPHAGYRNSIAAEARFKRNPGSEDRWYQVYSHPEVVPLLVLLDEGIHYPHLTFEQLQFLSKQRDAAGRKVTPDVVINNALWMSMELRQRVLNCQDAQAEIGLKTLCGKREFTTKHKASPSAPMRKTPSEQNEPETLVSASNDWTKTPIHPYQDEHVNPFSTETWRSDGKPRRFWIPNMDSTSVMGDSSEAATSLASNANNASRDKRSAQTRHPTTNEQHTAESFNPADDAQSAQTPLPKQPSTPRSTSGDSTMKQYYTKYPPFRFSAEFPNPRLLKEKKRVYSRTVWYAGSMWNIYIQKVRSTKNVQLGVYLHRAREEKSGDLIYGPSLGVPVTHGSVDERIGHLEREMLMRRTERRARRQQQYEAQLDDQEDTSSGNDGNNTVLTGTTAVGGTNAVVNGIISDVRKASQSPTLTLSSIPNQPYDPNAYEEEEFDKLIPPDISVTVPAMPPYLDTRPTVKTYFKIYLPSKGGKMLSIYESAPDRFNFSQSWGWKSSTLILDGGMEEALTGRNGRLRFMVTLGHV